MDVCAEPRRSSCDALFPCAAQAHDIPNARVDRSIQVNLDPGRLEIDYEVSLSELTLTRDLRMLIGVLPGIDRQNWFPTYGRETGPLNGRGLLVAIDRRPLELRFRGSSWPSRIIPASCSITKPCVCPPAI